MRPLGRGGGVWVLGAWARARGRFWFRGQKRGNAGSLCLARPVPPRGTTERMLQASATPYPLMTIPKRVPNSPAPPPPPTTQEHNYSHANPLPPIQTRPVACTKATNHILYLDRTRKNDGSRKDPKVRKRGVAVFGQARTTEDTKTY